LGGGRCVGQATRRRLPLAQRGRCRRARLAVGVRPGVIEQQSEHVNHQLARGRHATTADAASGNLENVDDAGSGGKLVQIRGFVDGYTRKRAGRWSVCCPCMGGSGRMRWRHAQGERTRARPPGSRPRPRPNPRPKPKPRPEPRPKRGAGSWPRRASRGAFHARSGNGPIKVHRELKRSPSINHL